MLLGYNMNVFFQTLLFLLLCLFALAASASHQPLWEAGAGIGGISTPYYPGSSYRKDYFIPVPFMRLRGKIFRSDEDGTRGMLYNDENVSLDISLAGSVPVPKAYEGARKGMPSLDASGEIGPAFQYRLWQSSTRRDLLQLEVPVRAVISLGEPVLAYQGWRVAPFLYYLHKKYSSGTLWRTSLSIGPMYGDRRYHAYFYQVDPQYANPDRVAYQAAAGYSGSRVTLTFSHNSRSSFIGLFMRYDYLGGAVFADSPLVEQKDYSIFGIVGVWIFSQSNAGAAHEE